MVVAEVVAAESWLFDKLDAAFAVPVYSGAGPEDAPYPFIVFAYLDGSDHMTADGTRVWSQLDYVVRYADRAESLSTMKDPAVLIDQALHRQQGVPLAGGLVLSCVREEPFRQREVIEGVVFLSLGGIYRLLVGG